MASIAQLIGNRPVKYSVGQAIGDIVKGTSQHFGELAIAKKNAEALKAAREYDAAQTAEAREYSEGVRADERAWQVEQADKQHATARAEHLADTQMGWAREDALNAQEAGKVAGIVSVQVEGDTIPHIVLRDERGNVVKDMGRDPDYATDDEGRLVTLSSGNKSAATNKTTEAQDKFALHSENMDMALQGMSEILGMNTQQGGNGYLRSFEGLKDQVFSVGGGWGNWLSSQRGKAYLETQRLAGESIWKAMSGAAGSDPEAARFYSMLPSFGDDDQTARMKMDLMNNVVTHLRAVSGRPEMQDTETRRDHMLTYTYLQAARMGLDTKSPTQQTTTDYSPDELGWLQDIATGKTNGVP